MKRFVLLAFSLLALAIVATGCMNTRQTAPASRVPTYALVVSVNGGQPPTDEQWAALQKKFAAELASKGYVLITDATLADRVIHVQFFPDPNDPTNGTAYVVGVRANSGSLAFSSARAMPASYSYAYNYNNAFGYYDNYYDTSNYYMPASSGTVIVPPTNNKDHHHPSDPNHPTNPGNPNDCPPGKFVEYHPPHHNPGDGDRPPRPEPGYSRGDSGGYASSSNSSRDYSSGNSSSSYSSSYAGPSTSYSNSSSYSAPSISFSSSSSDSSFSSGSSSSFSSGSSSSYSPPADTGSRDTGSGRQPN